MARMHSRKKGKSKSTKPTTEDYSWVRYSAKEVELVIKKLAKEGQTASEIGIHLRDTYGIPDVRPILKRKITKVLEDVGHKKVVPEDLQAMFKKADALQKHLQDNHKDFGAKHGLQLTTSKIKRLVKYYKANDKLPTDFKLDMNKLSLYLE